MTGQYALYRYFDATDRLLYVGKSGNLAARGKAHIRTSQWMQFASRSAIERYDSPGALTEAERTAIQTEGPVFNLQYNDTPEAKERLRAYLEEVGRLDLMPASRPAAGPWCPPDPGDMPDDLIEALHLILTADTVDHAGIRLRALALLEGYQDLPHGMELDRLASVARVNRATAYRARRTAVIARGQLRTPA